MSRDHMDDTMRAVASILSIAVLIDQRQRDREMIEFSHAVMSINQTIRPDVILPRQTILAWFENQKAEFLAHLAADDSQDYIVNILRQIKDAKLQRTLMAAIFSIAICDYEFRDEEAQLIKTALGVWSSGLPKAEDLARLAG